MDTENLTNNLTNQPNSLPKENIDSYLLFANFFKSPSLNSYPEVGSVYKDKNTPGKSRKSKDSFWWKEKRGEVSSIVIKIISEFYKENKTDLADEDYNFNKEKIWFLLEKISKDLSESYFIQDSDILDAVNLIRENLNGWSCLECLLEDSEVTDIYIDDFTVVRCLRNNQISETGISFICKDEYEVFFDRLLSSVDRELSHEVPVVDLVLNDFRRTRVNGIHHSLLDSNCSSFVFRIPRVRATSFPDLIAKKTLPPGLAIWLSELVSLGEANVLVSGATGSGKTTLVSTMLSAVSASERILTIEDIPEIHVPFGQVEKLVSRPVVSGDINEVTVEELLRVALRRSPHRIVIGEVRDREAPLLLKTLETGHAGSFATIHARNCYNSLWRLLDLSGEISTWNHPSLIRRISRTVHICISMAIEDGTPVINEVAEVIGGINVDFKLLPLIKFEGRKDNRRFWSINSESLDKSYWVKRLMEIGVELNRGQYLELS